MPTIQKSYAPNARIVPTSKADDPSEAENPYGWGFKDTEFQALDNGNIVLTGNRYNISGIEMPRLLGWMGGQLAMPLRWNDVAEVRPVLPSAPREAAGFLKSLSGVLAPDQIATDPETRLRGGHGHTGEEIYHLFFNRIARVPDMVVFPQDHEQVVAIVRAAAEHGVCLIPYGGGTNVTSALACPENEERPICSVNMQRMNRISWIDPVNRTAEIQAGAMGRKIMAELAEHGFTMGHEPDSVEFSTLGGWIATHASGMKKNRYGNIEDIVLDMTVVTPDGTLSHHSVVPRESIGTDVRKWIFGSEGMLGIVTSAVVKLFPRPGVQRYGSIIFPGFEKGAAFLYDVALSGLVPASVRLLDNTQFHFGQALKPAAVGLAKVKSAVEKFVLERVKGFHLDRLAVVTLVYEGTAAEVAMQERNCATLAKRHGGMQAGPENGERGYSLTFGIAYIRDLVFRHHMMAESFETSVPWSAVVELFARVKARAHKEHAARGLPGKPFITGRVTQIYATGVCCYFYMGFYAKGVEHAAETYLEIERAVRAEILACGGSLSHHHGIGKIRDVFLKDIQSPAALTWLKKTKVALDPKNIFGAQNLGLSADALARAANGEGRV
jgi:alkyldihydroxyacetonephosphate synthase